MPVVGPGTPPSLAMSSPALRKYPSRLVQSGLDLAEHLAYYSVADPSLLATESRHTSISDYAHITRYLTPQEIRYLAWLADTAKTSG